MRKKKSDSEVFEGLVSSFHQKRFDPVYLFYGEEDLLIDEAVESLIDNAVEESARSFNLDILYGNEVDARNIVSYASSFPMMVDRRVVVVREFDKLSNGDALLPYIERPSPSTVLVLISDQPDFRLKLFKTLKERARVVEFGQLYENAIPQWIVRRVEKLGKKITPEACQMILAHVGSSLREVQNEIDKLFIFVAGKPTIDEDDVNSVVGHSKKYNIFELQKFIGQKNLSRSVEILERMLGAGDSPVGVVVMLTKYFQKLWLLKELRAGVFSEFELAAKLHVPQFFLREYLAGTDNYSSAQLEDCFAALLDADEALKSGNGSEKLVMTLLLYRCLHSSKISRTT